MPLRFAGPSHRACPDKKNSPARGGACSCGQAGWVIGQKYFYLATPDNARLPGNSPFLRCVLQKTFGECLELDDILRLRAFLALRDGKLNALTFMQFAETVADNCAEVDKNVGTGLAFNKAKAFRAVEPLHNTLFFLGHDLDSLLEFC
jgi:hypothetical protein